LAEGSKDGRLELQLVLSQCSCLKYITNSKLEYMKLKTADDTVVQRNDRLKSARATVSLVYRLYHCYTQKNCIKIYCD